MIEQVIDFFVTSAYADTGTGAPVQGGGLSLVVMFAVFFIFMYFTIWRPQSKRAKELQALLESLAKGDEVVTSGGMMGKIANISGQYVTLSVSERVDIVMQKSSITNVMPKGALKSIG